MRVGIFHPEFWAQHGHWSYRYQIPARTAGTNSIAYHINEASFREGDFIVVHENVDHSLKLKSSAGGFILVTGEEKSIVPDYPQEFIEQFDCVVTSRDDIRHPNVVRTHYWHPWRVKRTYEELESLTLLSKTKALSAIISSLTTLPGHKERFDMISQLKKHYGNDLDWFSKGQNTFLEDKWDGLAPYKYSVAVENSQYANYFTEKITDCFLAYTMPFYFGCPNTADFFDERSFIRIDCKDVKGTINRIEDALKEDISTKNFEYVKESRRLVLEKYNFMASLTMFLQSYPKGKSQTSRTLRPQQYFRQGPLKRLLRSSVDRLMAR